MKAKFDTARHFWYVGDDLGTKLRHGRRNAFVTRYKTAAAAQARADRINAGYQEKSCG